jgi:hypothetical protein
LTIKTIGDLGIVSTDLTLWQALKIRIAGKKYFDEVVGLHIDYLKDELERLKKSDR